MKKIIVVLVALYISALFSFSAQGSENAEFKSIYSQGNTTIVLVNKIQLRLNYQNMEKVIVQEKHSV